MCGTLATVVYHTVLRREAPAPAVKPAATKPGVAYEYFESSLQPEKLILNLRGRLSVSS